MEHVEAIIFIPYFALTVIVLALTIWWAISFRKIIRKYENKNKQGALLDSDDLSGRYMDVQCGEQQALEMYSANN